MTATLAAELPEDSLGLTQERFGFTLFMSICVHAMIILGIGFTVASQPRITSTMDITLAHFDSETAPEDADFLAQANQEGSGTEEDLLAPATDTESRFSDQVIRDVSDFLTERPATLPNQEQNIIASEGLTSPDGNQQSAIEAPADMQNLSPEEISNTVASLQAQLDLHRQAYAKRPRRYTMTSASTKKDADALYLDNWRKRIEAIGNLNYPDEASSLSIYGTLRLMVSVKPDGTVQDIRILRSSGERVLDEAAIRIVQLSAPFEPFSSDMKTRVDILEIIRTWQFHRGDKFSSF